MGQQQLMLVILGMVIIGIAITVGMSMFQEEAVSSARDAVINNLNDLASRAQAYYRRPAMTGGGGASFAAITMGDLTSASSNEIGRFFISSKSASQIVITGVGKELAGSDSVEARVTVFANTDSLAIAIIH